VHALERKQIMQNHRNSLEEKVKKIDRAYRNFQAKKIEILLNRAKSFKYFRYRNLVKNEPNFCPLFSLKKKCHNISNLNCWSCYCDYYDRQYIDKENGLIGRCSIGNENGKYTRGVWDCSNCGMPHK